MSNSHKVNYSVKRGTLAWVAISALLLQLVSPAVFGLPVAKADAGVYTITGTATPNGLFVTVSGSASANPFTGQADDQHVSIDWNEDNSAKASNASNAWETVLDIVATGSSFGPLNWSGSHTFPAAGSYTIFVRVHHAAPGGNESGSATINFPLELLPQCNDDIDNDDDGLIDYPSDLGCENINDDSESPDPVTTGTLTIVKVLPNNNGGTATEGDFAVYIDGSATTWGSHELLAGSYTVSEDVLAGYEQDFSSCGTDGVVIVTEGLETICTITNDDIAPSLTLVKEVDNTNVADENLMSSAGAWTLTATGTVGSPTNLSGTTPVASGVDFKADTYTLDESDGPDGYDASAWSCIKNDGGAVEGSSIALALGDNATCTITNTARGGSITLIKNVVNNYGGDNTDLGGLGVDDFGLFVDDNPSVLSGIPESVSAGSHYIGELVKPGYLFEGITGDDACGSLTESEGVWSGLISIGLGQSISCTITNTDQPASLTVIKYVYNADIPEPIYTSAETDFIINVDGTDVSDDSFNGSSDGVTVTLDAGSYNVTENPVDGYSATMSADCSSETSLNGNIKIGEHRTCIIVNSSDEVTKGRIIVDKVTDPAGDTTLFNFTLTASSNFSLTDESSSYISDFIDPGEYTLEEEIQVGWEVPQIVCSDEELVNGNSVTLNISGSSDPESGVPGETVICTVYNTKLAQIVVEKITDPASEISFAFTTTYGDGFELSDTASNTSAYLEPGTYAVTEGEMPEGWYQGSATCDNGDTPAEITVGAGDVVTCTFTNTQYGSITIEKETNPSEAQQSFQFETSIPESNFELADGGSEIFNTLQPGVYTFTELATEGWTLTDLTCNGPEGSSSVDGSFVSVDLPAGENITCTFTNTEDSEPMTDLSVTKEVDDTTPNVGQTITYTVLVANAGPDEATGVVVADLLPSGVTYVSDEASQGTYNSETGQWAVGVLAAEGSATLTITVTVNSGTAGQTITNTASATSDQVDPDSENSSTSEDVTVNQQSDLSVTKAVDDTTPDVNQTITYTLTVSNLGPNEASSVVVTDNLPSGVTYVSHEASQGSYSTETGLWTVGTLGNESSATLTITVSVNSGTAGNTITNTATATSDQSDPDEQNSADSQDVNVNGTVVISGGGGGGGGGIPALYIHNELLGASTDTSVTITWNTNLEATSRVVYGPTSADYLTTPNYGYTLSTLEDMILSTFHTMVITGLTPGTQYFFRPVSAKAPVEVRGVELTHSTTGEVAGEQTQTTSSLPADESGAPTQSSGPDNSESLADDTGIVAGVETEQLAQLPEEDFSDLAPISVPAPETSETKSCNPWGWALVILNVIAAAWFWKKYSKSQKWNKYLWLINLGLTAVLTWLWLGNCAAWMWLLVLLIVTILYTLFTSEKGSTPAQA